MKIPDKGPVTDSENFRERRELPIRQLNREVMLCQLGCPVYGKAFTASCFQRIDQPSPDKNTESSLCQFADRCASLWFYFSPMKEIPRRRTTVTSSLNEISRGLWWGGGEGTPPSPTHFYSRILDRYLTDDENGFSCTWDIFFMAPRITEKWPWEYRVLH
jgi:hypothetical protein